MTPRIIPISDLETSLTRWTIKARVTNIQELHHYENDNGKGYVFNFDLLDSGGGEIRVICYNEVAEKFYSQIMPGNIYKISGGTMKPAKKQYNPINHDCEILLKFRSKVELCTQDDGTIPMQKFNFRSISNVGSMAKNDYVDIIGVVIDVGLADSVMINEDNVILKKTVCIMDASSHVVELSLWGDIFKDHGEKLQALHDSGEFPILAVKHGRVNEFNGKEVGTFKSTLLYINPDSQEASREAQEASQEARSVKEWFETEGKNAL